MGIHAVFTYLVTQIHTGTLPTIYCPAYNAWRAMAVPRRPRVKSRRPRKGGIAPTKHWTEPTLHYSVFMNWSHASNIWRVVSVPYRQLRRAYERGVALAHQLTDPTLNHTIGSLTLICMAHPIPWGGPERCGHVDTLSFRAYRPHLPLG